MRRMSNLTSALFLLAAFALAALTPQHADAQGACTTQAQTPQIKTGTTYTVAVADQCSLLDFTSASPIAVTMPNANTLPAGFTVFIKAGGSGIVTVTPTTSTVDGNASLGVNPGTSTMVWGNNANYFTAAGGAGGAFQSGQNIVQNGDFLIDQQYAGASQTVQTSLTRSIDRFFSIYTVSSSGGSAPTTQQVALSSGLTLTSKEFKLTNNASGATSVTAGMITRTVHQIEGSDVEDLNWNAASGGLPVTVSLWLKSSIQSADLGVSLVGASTESYTHDCVLSGTANTWTFCSFTVPAPNTGTWVVAAGSVGLNLNIAYQCGSTFQTPANAWAAGTFYCTANQTQVLGTNSATVEVAAVKLERGSMPTLFQSQPFEVSESVLRRFYVSTFPLGTAPAQNAGLAGALEGVSATATANTLGLYWRFPVQMYATPTTITSYNPAATNANCRDITTTATALTASIDPDTAKSMDGVFVACTGTPAAADHFGLHLSADAGI